MNGVLTVENGTVAAYKYKPASLLNGSNNTIVKGGGRLVGQMMLNNLSVQSGGELVPCGSAVNETSPGTITCNNTITVSDGAVVNFLVNASKNSTLTTKNLTINGTVKVTFTVNRELNVGDELKLWTVSGTFSGTPKFELPEAYTWDTSRISEGIISVVAISTDIRSSFVDADPKNIYDLQGRKFNGQSLKSGIYIRGGKKVIVR